MMRVNPAALSPLREYGMQPSAAKVNDSLGASAALTAADAKPSNAAKRREEKLIPRQKQKSAGRARPVSGRSGSPLPEKSFSFLLLFIFLPLAAPDERERGRGKSKRCRRRLMI